MAVPCPRFLRMSAVTGTDTSTPRGALGPLLAGVRRLMLLGDGASEADAVFRALARELLELQGAEEVHVHHLSDHDADELVDVYMFDGDGRLSYLLPRAERPPGVSWVAHTGRSVLIGDARELAESVPRLA